MGPSSGYRTNPTEIERFNEQFEDYYNELGIVTNEERSAFWLSMRSDLPNSFRFTGSKGHALTVQRRLIEHHIPQITSVTWDGEKVTPPTPIEWYPDRLAWSMTTPKNVIRKFPPFASFQKFLVSENGVGNITRQEIVSMIPPLFMGIEPGMTVLDMCAAPGSKSAQLIEMVHGGEEARVRRVMERLAEKQGRKLSSSGLEVDAEKDQAAREQDYADDGRATGLLIANDKEYRRAQMLIHQCKRLNSPNLIVTNHDATVFPSLQIPAESGRRYLKFDRILADVPCSGDGTCRKNLNVWKDWMPHNALGLHPTQCRILVRAIQMLKVGGRVVYSTCSLNPVENEAVVASAIERCGGTDKVKLVDTLDHLPSLKRKQGLKEWMIMDKSGHKWWSWDEVAAIREQPGQESLSRVTEDMFPPKPEAEIPLEKCVRVYPHLQDTGGFFIAVLEKQTEIKARPEGEPKQTNPVTAPSDTQSATKSAFTKIMEELEEQPASITNGTASPGASTEKITAPSKSATLPEETAPPVVRQNEENMPSPPTAKRPIEDAVSEVGANPFKRLRTSPEPPDLTLRTQHNPPPPGAMLDLTSHTPAAPTPQIKRPNPQNPHEEPFKYLPTAHPALASVTKYYGLNERFPRDRFMVRNATGEPVKAMYYTSALARDLLQQNEGKGIKFVHCGVKMFVKQEVSAPPKREDGGAAAAPDEVCKWRIQNEGLPIIEPWIGERRVVRLAPDNAGEKGPRVRRVLRKLLKEMFIKIPAEEAEGELGIVGEAVREIGMGCCVLRVELPGASAASETGAAGASGNDAGGSHGAEEDVVERFALPLWRGVSSVNLMLPKEDRRAMLLRLFDDDSPLVDQSQQSREQRQKAKQSQHQQEKQEAGPEREQDAREAQAHSKREVQDDDGRRNSSSGDEGVGGKKAELDGEADGRPDGEHVGQGNVAVGTEAEVEEREDVILARKQADRDAYKEAAPGVADEDDSFNRTV